MAGRGGAPGAQPVRRMGSVGAAEPRGQPRHQQQRREEEEEEEEPGSLERVEKSRKQNKKKKPTKKNQNEKPNGRSKYDMKICGQMRSREVPQRRAGTERGGRQCVERARLGQGLPWSPAWVAPCPGAQGPRWGWWRERQNGCQGWVGAPLAGAVLLYSITPREDTPGSCPRS